MNSLPNSFLKPARGTVLLAIPASILSACPGLFQRTARQIREVVVWGVWGGGVKSECEVTRAFVGILRTTPKWNPSGII